MFTLIAIICVLILGGIALYGIEHRQQVIVYYEKEKPVDGRIEKNREYMAKRIGRFIS